MAKKKTSEMHEAFSSGQLYTVDLSSCKEYKLFEYVLDEKNVINANEECLDTNDIEGVIEVFQIHLRARQGLARFKNDNAPVKAIPSKKVLFKSILKVLHQRVEQDFDQPIHEK